MLGSVGHTRVGHAGHFSTVLPSRNISSTRSLVDASTRKAATSSWAGSLSWPATIGKNISWSVEVYRRCFRSLYVAAAIVGDYKWSLWAFRRAAFGPEDTHSLAYHEYSASKSIVHLRCAKRLLDLFCTNGGIYIKLGQHIASLEYLLPIEYCKTMAVLQDAAPQSSLKDINRVFVEDLGRPFDEIYAEFDAIPIGTASLAQVHKARLKDGRPVAVKVQHYRLQDHARMDLVIVDCAIRAIKRLFPEVTLDWLADEMRTSLPNELDFIREGKNAERLGACFRADPDVKVPQINWPWSSHRILTMEYMPGAKINDTDFMKRHDISPLSVSNKLNEIYSRMIFEYGFLHCDPHPGNLFVRLKENGASSLFASAVSFIKRLLGLTGAPFDIIILDHGLYKEISDDFRLNYARLWMAIIRGRESDIKTYSMKVGGIDAHKLFTCMLTQRSWKNIESGVIGKGLTQTPEEIAYLRDKAGDYLLQVADILAKVPRPLLLILKTNDLLRSIGRALSSDAHSYITSHYQIMATQCIRALCREETKSKQGQLVQNMCIYVKYFFIKTQLSLRHVYMWVFSPV